MAGETCIDFDFMELLDCSSVSSGKKSNANGFLNSFNCSFDTISNYNLTDNDASDKDFATLLDKSRNSKSSGSISLASLAESHFSNILSSSLGEDLEKVVEDPFLFNLKNDTCDGLISFDSPKDIIFEKKIEEESKELSLDDFLSTFNWEHSADKSLDLNKEKDEFKSKEETSDDELIQDINLCFCIKNNNDKDEFSPVSSSLDSKDSGFYESDFSPVQFTLSSSDKTPISENLPGNDQVKFTLANARQSLLSRSIAAKPKIDKTRREKLNNIKSELLKKYIPQLFSKQDKEQKIQLIIDQSDQCAVTSNFLTVESKVKIVF